MTLTRTSPDVRLKKDVAAELHWSPGLDATRIGVTVAGGAVTLWGEVATYPERLLAHEAVQRLRGVRAIVEQITVRDGVTGVRDVELAREASVALARAVDVARDAVDASVRDRVVTLRGTVPWHYQSEAAVRSVSHLRGVRDVVNDVRVRAPMPTVDIRGKIDAALERHAVLEAAWCTVSVDAGAVTLEGAVGTWVERGLVERVAWSAPGVTSVHNRLRVTD